MIAVCTCPLVKPVAILIVYERLFLENTTGNASGRGVQRCVPLGALRRIHWTAVLFQVNYLARETSSGQIGSISPACWRDSAQPPTSLCCENLPREHMHIQEADSPSFQDDRLEQTRSHVT